MMLAAVVFDFDGVIVDTEPYHHRCFQELLAPFGISMSWEEYLESYIGYDDRDAFREAFRRSGRHGELDQGLLSRLIQEKSRLFPRLAAEAAVPYPGVVELILSLARQVPVALCSGALRSDILPVIGRLGIADSFSVIVTADDVAASKPDPEGYRLAVVKLSQRFPQNRIEPGRCCAIEDTPAGIASAKGAGLRVVGVTNSHPPLHLADADMVVTSLEEITIHDLSGLTEGC